MTDRLFYFCCFSSLFITSTNTAKTIKGNNDNESIIT